MSEKDPVIAEEIINIRRVVKGSKLGKHISENILIPILQQLDPLIDQMLDWIGWYLREEIKHVLATAKPSGFVYTVYAVNESATYGKYTEIGKYESSQRGGPPMSPDVGGDPDVPQSGNLLRSINYVVSGNKVILGIEPNDTSYHLWYNPAWPGKLFVSEDTEPRSSSVYGAILDSPEYEHQRPYFTSTIQQMKGKLKKQFREEFRKGVQKITGRPTVRRAIEIHFRWIED